MKKTVFYISLCAFYFWQTASASELTFPEVKTQKAIANENPSTILQKAHKAYLNEKYTKAMKLYKKYLRTHLKDFDVWNLFSATLYHTGNPRDALKYLKKSYPFTKNKTQNFYYQALCYDALGDFKKAKYQLAQTAKVKDPFGALSTIELAAIDYEEENYDLSLYWATQYLRRFPKGPQRASAKRIIRHIKIGKYTPLEISQRSRYRTERYKNNPDSLFDIPNSWFFQAGYNYLLGNKSEPQNHLGEIVTDSPFQKMYLYLAAGLGIGPIERKKSIVHFGYNYSQYWFSNIERLEVWMEEPTDIVYFPLRPDLMERKHQLYADAVRKFKNGIEVGAYGTGNIIIAGSEFLPAPEHPEIKESTNKSSAITVIPWVAWQYLGGNKLIFHLKLEKLLNQEDTDFSFKTYNLFDSTETPFMSFGIASSHLFQKIGLRLRADGFLYQYLYNDYWEDHEKMGFFALAEYYITDHWRLYARGGYYQDSYNYEQIRKGGCNPDNTEEDITSEATYCPRTDTGIFARFGASWIINPTNFLSVYGDYQSLENPDFLIYDKDAFQFTLQYSRAFPDVKSSTKYKRRFYETSTANEVF